MIRFFSLLVLLLASSLGSSVGQMDDPIASTPLGLVRGGIQASENGTTFYSFRGIRFAQPPVGERRFRNPVPVGPWEGVYDATKDGFACPQGNENDPKRISEDCLFLNVYTRRYNQTDELRPVFFFIHGGAYSGGNANFGGQNPQRLLDNDIVVVSTNYRLNTIGFFSTGDKWAPGNYGMKDQVAALRWVQDNIASFGGDPKSVTIAGQSAGAASVVLQVISPMSRGLFHRAIAISGSASIGWAVQKDASQLAKVTADLFKCPNSSTERMVSCLRNIPAFDTSTIYPGFWKWWADPMITQAPVVEAEGDEERFLTRDPDEALLAGDFAHVPLIIGTTTNEFESRALGVVTNPDLAADMSNRWNEIAPISFYYPQNDSSSQELRKFFLGSVDEPITEDSYTGIGEMYADSLITFGVLRTATIMAKTSTAPVYLYQFNFQGRYSFANWPGTSTPMGVAHSDDLIYLFKSSSFPQFEPDSAERDAANRLQELYYNFITTGNPTPKPTTLNNVTWPPLTADQPAFLDFNGTTKIATGIYFKDRFDLWDKVVPLPKL